MTTAEQVLGFWFGLSDTELDQLVGGGAALAVKKLRRFSEREKLVSALLDAYDSSRGMPAHHVLECFESELKALRDHERGER